MDMVVYTGGNACSLLSDLISIQGLIHIFSSWVVPYKVFPWNILHGSEKYEVQIHFIIALYCALYS